MTCSACRCSTSSAPISPEKRRVTGLVMIEPMTTPRARCAALVSTMALAFAMAAGGMMLPSQALAQQQSGVVGRIVVQGNERIEPTTILSYLPIQVGDTIDQAKLDLAVKTLA